LLDKEDSRNLSSSLKIQTIRGKGWGLVPKVTENVELAHL